MRVCACAPEQSDLQMVKLCYLLKCFFNVELLIEMNGAKTCLLRLVVFEASKNGFNYMQEYMKQEKVNIYCFLSTILILIYTSCKNENALDLYSYIL